MSTQFQVYGCSLEGHHFKIRSRTSESLTRTVEGTVYLCAMYPVNRDSHRSLTYERVRKNNDLIRTFSDSQTEASVPQISSTSHLFGIEIDRYVCKNEPLSFWHMQTIATVISMSFSILSISLDFPKMQKVFNVQQKKKIKQNKTKQTVMDVEVRSWKLIFKNSLGHCYSYRQNFLIEWTT